MCGHWSVLGWATRPVESVRMAFNVIGGFFLLASFVLPIYAVWFWVSLYRRERYEGALWRRVVGFIAAVLATCAIGWRYVFPLILHHHYSRIGSEDQTWWAIMLWSIRLGACMSLAGVVLGAMSKGQTRLFSAVSSAVMMLAYFVLFAIR